MTEPFLPRTFEADVEERVQQKLRQARERGAADLSEFDLSKIRRAAEQEVMHEADDKQRFGWEVARAMVEDLRERAREATKALQEQKLADFQKARARRLKGG